MKKFLVISLFFVACSGAKKQTQADIPMHAPPTDEVVMPKGGPMLSGENGTMSGSTPVLDSQTLSISKSHFKQFLSHGPAFAFSLFELSPYKSEGKLKGYKILKRSSSAKHFLNSILLENDVVTFVNGLEIATPDAYFAAWKSLEKSSKIRIDFIRDGVPQHTIWQIEEPQTNE